MPLRHVIQGVVIKLLLQVDEPLYDQWSSPWCV